MRCWTASPGEAAPHRLREEGAGAGREGLSERVTETVEI